MHPKRSRKAVVIIGAAFVVLVGMLIVGALRVRSLIADVRADAARGQRELLAGTAILKAAGPGLTETQAQAAADDLRTAQVDFAASQAILAHSRFATAASRIPGLRQQVVAATSLTDMGLRVSRIGQLAVESIQTALAQPGVNQAPGERALQFLDAFDPRLASIEMELQYVSQDRARIPSSGLLPELSQAVKQFDSKINVREVETTIHSFRTNEQAIRLLLGASQAQRYLVLQQDPAELRATGGFIGSIGYLEFDHGKMTPYQPEDVYSLDGDHYGSLLGPAGSPRHLDPPYPLESVFRLKSWELRDSNWSPDFPSSARQAESFLKLEAGKRVDGVVAIDPFLIAKLLSVTGPVKVPETGDVVTDKNFFETTLNRVELHQGISESARKGFLSYAAKAIFARLVATPSKAWPFLLRALQAACDSRSLQAYFDDPQLEALMSSYHCAGQVQPFAADGIMVVDSNLAGAKDDFWLKRSFGLQLEVHLDGSIRHTLHLHYDGLTPHQGLTGPWGYTGWTRLYLPASSHVVSVGGATLKPASDLGRMVLEGWLYVPYYRATDITVVYDTDSHALSTAGGELNFLWQKQAGRVADPISIQVSLPSGWKVGATRMGADPSTDSVIHTDLSVDRPFVFHFERT